MITLSNHTFRNIDYVQRAFDLLSARNNEARKPLSEYEVKLSKLMYQYLKKHRS
jgi:hypothetical protein